MDDQASESRTRALRSEYAWATPFACPDVSPGMIAMTLAAVVQKLTGRADIAIVFRFVSETLGTEEWTPLSVDTVADPHIGVMLRSANHCKNSPFPYVVSAATDSGSRPCHAYSCQE